METIDGVWYWIDYNCNILFIKNKKDNMRNRRGEENKREMNRTEEKRREKEKRRGE